MGSHWRILTGGQAWSNLGFSRVTLEAVPQRVCRAAKVETGKELFCHEMREAVVKGETYVDSRYIWKQKWQDRMTEWLCGVTERKKRKVTGVFCMNNWRMDLSHSEVGQIRRRAGGRQRNSEFGLESVDLWGLLDIQVVMNIQVWTAGEQSMLEIKKPWVWTRSLINWI